MYVKLKKKIVCPITAEGLALPCCWTAGRMYKWWHKDPKVEQIWDYIPKETQKLNARKLGLDKVFETGIFEQIQDSWSFTPSCEQGKLKVCALKCGVCVPSFEQSHKYTSMFKYDTISELQPQFGYI